MLREEYIEKIYAGWLAKIIGIRLGAPVEGWTCERIKNVYGEIDCYPVEYREFAADDDSNGPLFFLRALENSGRGADLSAQDVGEALLNYAPFEHGFFSWAGYGVSTEHTAYLNLRHGIPAPRSGSAEQNGPGVAEQIGGQIFIDSWGLVAPGNPDLAARLAEKAASVTHGGNGVYGGMFIAACISHAFEERDIRKIIQKGLSYIPEDSEYARVVKGVEGFHDMHPENWRECFHFVQEYFGYDRYPGGCHIIPNTAVIILSLLYGKGDFSDTVCICNMCGWDTDCNAGNVATIMGVRGGLSGIDYGKWRKPINDFLVCSSVVGSLNVMDIPFGASYILKQASLLAGEELPPAWDMIVSNRIDGCHFEYPGSTHAIRMRLDANTANPNQNVETRICNSDETARSGKRSLKVVAKPVRPGQRLYVYKKTYYKPSDFHNSRYDPSFSPLVYPGQTLRGSAYIPEYGKGCIVQLYARNARGGEVLLSEEARPGKGEWVDLEFEIPSLDGLLIDEVGFAFTLCGEFLTADMITAFIDDLYFDGDPDYTIDFSKEEVEMWTPNHTEISQFTRLKGILYLEDGQLNLSCSDFAEAYTGGHGWKDYTAIFRLTPRLGDTHQVNFRVQGAIRSYAVALLKDNRIALLKNQNGYVQLADAAFEWNHGQMVEIKVSAKGNHIAVWADGQPVLNHTDEQRPYMAGSIGVSVRGGSHCRYGTIKVCR